MAESLWLQAIVFFIWIYQWLVQDRSISIALAMEMLQSCTKPSIVTYCCPKPSARLANLSKKCPLWISKRVCEIHHWPQYIVFIQPDNDLFIFAHSCEFHPNNKQNKLDYTKQLHTDALTYSQMTFKCCELNVCILIEISLKYGTEQAESHNLNQWCHMVLSLNELIFVMFGCCKQKVIIYHDTSISLGYSKNLIMMFGVISHFSVWCL